MRDIADNLSTKFLNESIKDTARFEIGFDPSRHNVEIKMRILTNKKGKSMR